MSGVLLFFLILKMKKTGPEGLGNLSKVAQPVAAMLILSPERELCLLCKAAIVCNIMTYFLST